MDVFPFRLPHGVGSSLRYTQHGDHLDTKQMKYKWHLLNLLLFFPTVSWLIWIIWMKGETQGLGLS